MASIYSAYAKALALKQRIAHSRLVLGPPKLVLNHPRIIFVHVPKAGGTSLAFQFKAILGSGLQLNYAHDPVLVETPGEQSYPISKALVFGHFHPAIYDHSDAFRITFLRHPVDNLLSIYAFWKTVSYIGHPLHTRFLKERPSVIEFCRYEKFRNLMSETFFGNYDMDRFDFIGFDESRVADLACLSRLIGAEISPDVRVNQTSYSDADEELRSDRALRSRVTDLLRQDVRFFEKTQARVRQWQWGYQSSSRA